MISEDVNALTNRFFDLFDETDVNILVEGQPTIDVDETRCWMRFTVSPGFGKQSTMSENAKFQQLGVATLQVFAPEGHGTYEAFQIQDKFMLGFRNWRSADKKIHVYKSSNDKSTQDGYTQYNINVFWESQR